MVVSTAFELRFGVSGQINLPLWGLQVSASAGGGLFSGSDQPFIPHFLISTTPSSLGADP